MTTTRFLVHILLVAAALAAMLLAAPVSEAAERTVVLTVPDMECGSSEIQAEMALTGLEGVMGVVLDTDEQTATVTYDDGAVGVEDMKGALEEFNLPVSGVRNPDEE